MNGDALTLSPDLIPRIRIERAKALAHISAVKAAGEAGTDGQQQNLTMPPSPPRLTVDLPSKTIHFDGNDYDCTSDRALRWVKILADCSPTWVSSADLEKIDRELLAPRTDKLKKLLPSKISILIESKTGAGSRLLFDRK